MREQADKGLDDMVTRERNLNEPARLKEPAGLEDFARDLAAPVGEIVDALHRIALHNLVVRDPDTAAPDLLWRARHLADELAQVIAALAMVPRDPVDARAPHTTLLVRDAIARAADVCAEVLGDRRVVVRCSSQLALTTQAEPFHELLVVTIDEAARRRSEQTDVRISAQRSGTRLVIEVDTGVVAGHGIERLHHLVRAIGGRIEVLSGPETRSALRIHIPQARGNDVGELPDDVA
jgi:K+-sensing histidine kinase KdpD